MTKSSHVYAKGKSSEHPATEQSRRERESEQTYYVWDDPVHGVGTRKWQKIFSQGRTGRHLGGGFGLSGDTPLIAKWKWARTGIRPFGIPVVHAGIGRYRAATLGQARHSLL